jgi:hypothetical protein
MLRTTAVATLLALCVAGPASAAELGELPTLKLRSTGLLALMQDDDEDFDDEDLDDEDLDDDVLGDEEPEEESTKPAEDEATQPTGGAKVGKSVGGAVGFVRSTGFYTLANLGGFLRFGGFADSATGFRDTARVTSNLQPHIGLAVGYDILEFLGVQLSFGTGFVANAAPRQGTPDSPRDYGITFLNLAVVGNLYFDRLGISGKVFGGGALITPPPLPDVPVFGGNAGGGLGVRWATLLTDVTIGADVDVYVSFSAGGDIIPGIAFAPIIKYVF